MASASSLTASGGDIDGYELSYQQDFTFLPSFWKNFGVQANYTHLTSELQYIVDPGNTLVTPTTPLRPQVTSAGPFTGASPDSANFTLYYETPKWSARASYAYRSAYVSQYPIAAGTCDPGVCDAPLVNDFLGSLATRNIDAKVTWQATDYLSLHDRRLEPHESDRRSLGVPGRAAGHPVLEHGPSDLRGLPSEPLITGFQTVARADSRRAHPAAPGCAIDCSAPRWGTANT